MVPEGLRALIAALGAAVVTGDAIERRFEQDWSGLPPVRPLAVLRPRSTDDLARAVTICAEYRLPMTPQGGLTGLAGGAHPSPDAVAISLDRMSGVEAVDADAATITVLAGTPLSTVQRAAEAECLYVGVDLGARDSCTIGGMIGTNAGGNRVVRYGMMRDNVLGLEAVLADGTIVRSLGGMLKNNTGTDWKHLLIGTEGTLGIVTRAVLRLHAKPALQFTALVGCDNYDAMLALLRRARTRLGPALTSFEAMWPSFYDFLTDALPSLRRPLGRRHGAYVLIESSGYGGPQDRQAFEALLESAVEDGIIADAVIAESEQQTADLWAVRDAPSEYNRVLGPITAFDVSVPLRRMGALVEATAERASARWPAIRMLAYGHMGDSNLHLVCNVPSADVQPSQDIAALVYGLVAEAEGSVSAEHGIGLLKKPYLSLSRAPEELALMKRIKDALDPHDLMNRGKVLS